jgi:CheY-like chemotaxis protein
MAGGIAHDFNNILTSISGNLGLARRWLQLQRDATRFLDSIETAVRKAADLCEHMLAYAGHDLASLEPAQLNDAIEGMAGLTRAAVNPKIRTEFRLSRDLPPILCSKGQLGQVVLNLVNNSADAIGDRPGSITVSSDVFDVDGPLEDCLPQSPPPGPHVRLQVADTGHGLDAEAQARMFDPFYSTKASGHGLGLSAVLGIVRSHGAAIHVASAVDAGTTVTVYFPVYDHAASRQDHDATGPQWTEGAGVVLVVDDDPDVRGVARLLLREAGYQVIEASDGDEAIRGVEASRDRLDAILLDLSMPRRDGLSALEEIRKLHPGLPVLLSSGRLVSLPPQHRDDPSLYLLHKPYDAKQLVSEIARAIAECGVRDLEPS